VPRRNSGSLLRIAPSTATPIIVVAVSPSAKLATVEAEFTARSIAPAAVAILLTRIATAFTPFATLILPRIGKREPWPARKHKAHRER